MARGAINRQHLLFFGNAIGCVDRREIRQDRQLGGHVHYTEFNGWEQFDRFLDQMDDIADKLKIMGV